MGDRGDQRPRGRTRRRPARRMRGALARLARSGHEPRAVMVPGKPPLDRFGRGGRVMSELKLITPRRNVLIRALGFTAAGATLPIGIIAADDAGARIAHHQSELEKAWADYYGP